MRAVSLFGSFVVLGGYWEFLPLDSFFYLCRSLGRTEGSSIIRHKYPVVAYRHRLSRQGIARPCGLCNCCFIGFNDTLPMQIILRMAKQISRIHHGRHLFDYSVFVLFNHVEAFPPLCGFDIIEHNRMGYLSFYENFF